MTDAAMNIHIQVFMGSFLGLELLGHTVGISFPL